MTAPVKVSVVVPHYNDLAGLDLCLSALERQTYPAAEREIIVADNASPLSPAALDTVVAGRARLVVVSEKGAGPARNGGVAVAQGSIIAFTDADCQPASEWLVQGLAALASYDFAGGRINVTVADPHHVKPAEAFERVFAFDAERYIKAKGFVATCNLFCPRAVFDAVGGFGNGVSEDVDWSHRAGALGFRIGYAPDAVVSHPARPSWKELKRKWVRINSETYALTVRKPSGRLIWALRSLALPLSALAHTLKVLRSSQLRGVGERFGALAVLYRLRLWRTADAFRLVLRKP